MLRIHLLAALLGTSLAVGCAKQGEGERCDPNSGSLDCDTGLICRPSSQLSVSGTGFALCCPPDDVRPNVSACSAGAMLPPDTALPSDPSSGSDAGDGGS